MDWEGSELINWFYQRCGKSEEAHAVMKDDLAGGKLPSGDFGENAAWWWIMILALNLNAIMKRFVLGKKWVPKRLKAIRFQDFPQKTVIFRASTCNLRLFGFAKVKMGKLLAKIVRVSQGRSFNRRLAIFNPTKEARGYGTSTWR